MNLVGIAEQAVGEIKSAQLKNLYQRDFIAWRSDVLGYNSYQKMNAICETALFGAINRTAIKSSNGTSKSHEVANMVTWVSSVFEPGETVSIITAPSLAQVEKTIFAYVKSARTRAQQRGFELPGWVNESLELKYAGAQGNITLAFGRKPASGSEVSSFQGVRSQHGKTYVWFDEAGGLSRNMWTAAEAVLTGADARLISIGNPDDAGTEWEKIFKDKKYDGEFNRFTISSYDLPTFTGEKVYDDPAMQTRMLKSLTQVSWVEHKKRIWGEHDARFRSKVLGEFPEDGGTGFFGQAAINKAFDTEIQPDDSTPIVLGVDVARMGTDETVVYSNQGGKVRLAGAWGKTDTWETTVKVHEIAVQLGAVEVRIDGTGVGAGVWDNLAQNPQFADGGYATIGIEGASKSPDLAKWVNKRAFTHDSTREQMMAGLIDLDIEDEELREQLGLISYKFSNRGGIQVAGKSEIKTELGGSPDRADAFIYATCDLSLWTGNPLNEMVPGERVVKSPEEILAPLNGFDPWYGQPGQAF